jgi:hypothetical protein
MTSVRQWHRRYQMQVLRPLNGVVIVIWIDGELLDSYFGSTLPEAAGRVRQVVGEDLVLALRSR